MEMEDFGVCTAATTAPVKVPVRLWSMVYSVLTACFPSLLVGATLTFSSPTLVELTQLDDPDFRFGALLSDIFGVRETKRGLAK